MPNDIRTRIREAVTIDGHGCWIWTRSIASSTGYGRVSVNGKTIGAHVASYEAFVRPIPAGLEIDHLCRVRRCVRPDHLEAVPHRVNVLRAPGAIATINGAKTHCPRHHEFTPDNTCWQRGGTRRYCRTCSRAAGRRYRAARRQLVSA